MTVGVVDEVDENEGVLGPDTRDHAPVPTEGVLLLKLNVVTLHSDWLVPALAAVAGALLIIVTALGVRAGQPLTALGVN